MKYSFLILLSALNFQAIAQSDCGKEVEEEAKKCEGGVLSAKTGNQESNTTGVNNDGLGLAAAAGRVSAALESAKTNCLKENLENCKRKCDAAKKSGNPQLTAKAEDNLQECRKRVALAIGDANESIGSMNKVAADSENTSRCASTGECVQQVNNRCPAGMFWSVRWNQCAGLGAFTPRDMIPTPLGK